MADIIPQQSTGNARDNYAAIELPDRETATAFYSQVRARLLDVNNWKDRSGFLSAEFTLVDRDGKRSDAPPKPGDYFKIKLPPIPVGEYDWVRIEKVEEHSEQDHDYTAIRVRPAEDPFLSGKGIHHFYTADATSSFIVSRVGNLVTAEVHGRNEEANTETSSTLLAGIRNLAVASGALIGLSDFQWNKLVKGLLQSP